MIGFHDIHPRCFPTACESPPPSKGQRLQPGKAGSAAFLAWAVSVSQAVGGASRRGAIGMSIPNLPAAARTRIKICGLTREADVDAAVAAGADAVGFVMYEASPRYVTAERAAELARRLPPFVTPVLLFVNESTLKIIAACAHVPTALLQFHGDETPEVCRQAGRPFMRAARIPLIEFWAPTLSAARDSLPPEGAQFALGRPGGESPAGLAPFDLVKYAEDFKEAQAILLDAHVEGYGGGGKTFNWSLLPPSVNAHLVLSGGLTPANVTDGILQVRPRCKTLAVDVSSGVEISKGIKSAEKINQFVAAVRAADEQFENLAGQTRLHERSE